MVSVVTDLADEIKELPADADLGVVRHPSGWWKSNERWNPPADADTTDRMVALSIAIAAVAAGSIMGGGPAGNLALLLSGTAGALITRWWLDGRVDRRLMAASSALCATASATLIAGVMQLDPTAASSQRGLFVAAVASVMASALSIVELSHHRLVSA
jgi:hypothetical protein